MQQCPQCPIPKKWQVVFQHSPPDTRNPARVCVSSKFALEFLSLGVLGTLDWIWIELDPKTKPWHGFA